MGTAQKEEKGKRKVARYLCSWTAQDAQKVSQVQSNEIPYPTTERRSSVWERTNYVNYSLMCIYYDIRDASKDFFICLIGNSFKRLFISKHSSQWF